MTQADDRLKALFALDEPPARDPAFSTAVMEQVMRRRFQEDVALLCGVSVVGGGGALAALADPAAGAGDAVAGPGPGAGGHGARRLRRW